MANDLADGRVVLLFVDDTTLLLRGASVEQKENKTLQLICTLQYQVEEKATAKLLVFVVDIKLS